MELLKQPHCRLKLVHCLLRQWRSPYERLPAGRKALAELSHDFLQTPLGEYFLTQLSVHYNALHQAAESEELSLAQKAMKIERAAGVKFAIDWFTSRDALLAQGYFKDEEAA